MKKSLFGILAAATMLFTSCSQDDMGLLAPGEKATVTISLDYPTINSRAFSEGKLATHLQWAVYDLTEGTPVILSDLQGEDTQFTGKKAISMDLASGRSYGFVFWAGNDDAPYTVTFGESSAQLSVDYSEIEANKDENDAFYTYITHTVTGAENISAKLRRPFTQINYGTSDMTASKNSGYEPAQTQVEVTDVYSQLDLMSGEVSGEPQTVIFKYNALPADETYPDVKTGLAYDYLAMAYVLAPIDQALVDVTLYHKNAAGKEYKLTTGSVPVKRNFRTNLFGALLTDELSIEVETQPDFDGNNDQEIVNVPDGKAVMNGATYETIEAALAAMQSAGLTDATIYIGEGEYTAPKTSAFGSSANVVLKGNGDETVFNVDGARDFGSRSVTLALENMKVVHAPGTGTYTETYGSPWTRINGLTYTKCSVEGPVRLLVNDGATATFEECNFVNTTSSGFNGYSINYYAYTGSKVVINGCNFNTNSKAIVMYSESKVKFEMEVNNTTFTTTNTDDKAAIQMHTELGAYGVLTINKSKATGFDTTTEGEGLWSEIKNSSPYPRTYNFDIFVDGVQVHGSNKISVNGQEVTTLAEALANVQDGGTISLGYGDYDAKNVDWNSKNITIEGKGTNVTNIANLDFVDANGSTMTLSNLAFSPAHNQYNHTASGFRGTTKMTFNNCAINAEYHCYNGDFYFNKCQFNYNAATDPAGSGRYAIYAETSGTINCTDCIFSDTLMDKGILVYSANNTVLGDINLTKCVFNAANQTKKNGCVEIHAENLTQGGTVTFVNTTNNGFASLWSEKNGSKKFYTIVVDGSVQQQKD